MQSDSWFKRISPIVTLLVASALLNLVLGSLLVKKIRTPEFLNPVTAAEIPPRSMSELTSGTPPTLGRPDAPIQLVLFSDFECPYCRRLSVELDHLDPHLKERVRVVFRQFPLQIHKFAYIDAEVGTCAALQSNQAFWALYDFFYGQTSSEETTTLAVEMLRARKDVDMDKFSLCLREHQAVRSIEHDLALGESYGVRGTPTMFINGRRFVGSQPSLGLLLRGLVDRRTEQ